MADMDFEIKAKKLKRAKTKRVKKIETTKPKSLKIKKHSPPQVSAIPANNPAKKSKSEISVSLFILRFNAPHLPKQHLPNRHRLKS
ncbi:hypothetical protein NHP194003_12740 [Helicobacter suis]|uniref:Uncharacterized protein n=1 Tax=Helicobacter suis TaxID=104628 RepID=A0A6J4CYJ0_9HELI|nr:hypothetical protein NHP190020_10430 [Helicobacter suis]BDR28900.1 hypothetical protein HSHS1_16610 [Helicobacter suis HS1]BCD48070.1 hypothetical protein NHP194003_12740 [Helicobacter suis]BCD49832.1 hypothetical protein NHP194004_12790 [Helicobacter suis]BCD50965.1 hypothetical protein NHP194022_06360 [Helicobacter suis]